MERKPPRRWCRWKARTTRSTWPWAGLTIPAPGTIRPIAGANGDMGENDTAALDPIFYFHHCFVDRVFWLWQKRHGATDDLPVIEKYPGTNTVDNQGATPGMPPNSWLSMDTPLNPFTLTENGKSRAYTGRDGFNIERQLGYTYGDGSLEDLGAARRRLPGPGDSAEGHRLPASTAARSQAPSSSPPSSRSTGKGSPSGRRRCSAAGTSTGAPTPRPTCWRGPACPLHGLDARPARRGCDPGRGPNPCGSPRRQAPTA